MAQKPVANALTLELEPVVADNLARYLETANEWYAHDFVPFDQGENFAFLGGKDWDASQVTLPSDVVDALEVLLVTKDNLAGYHRELVEHFILENKWGRWLGRWTAEENLHAIAIREYLVVTRNFDPAANEDVRVAHVMRGYRGDNFTQIETLVFMALYERAHAVYVRNLEAKVTEPILKGLLGRIAADEERHEEFFHNLVAHCMEHHRESTIAAI
ncbi:MAG: acyl-ACP desaturase, partial [Mycobacterium sp.]|nr:acyl-ACP desaturase [Mycobacterium sp.]